MNVTLRNRTLIFVMVILVQILTLDNATEPGILDDKTSEMQSNTNSTYTNFTSSGGSGIVISGEPAYVGDTLTASLMVTNKGNSTGSVSLQINHSYSDQIFQGEYISISPGSTREVPTSFILELPGTNEFNWQLSILGQTGHTDLQGNLSIEVSNSQILNLTTDSISWSASEGRHCSDTPAIALSSDCIDKIDDCLITWNRPPSGLRFFLQILELPRARQLAELKVTAELQP